MAGQAIIIGHSLKISLAIFQRRDDAHPAIKTGWLATGPRSTLPRSSIHSKPPSAAKREFAGTGDTFIKQPGQGYGPGRYIVRGNPPLHIGDETRNILARRTENLRRAFRPLQLTRWDIPTIHSFPIALKVCASRSGFQTERVSIGIFEGFVGSIVGDRGPMFVRLVKTDGPPHR